MLKWTARAFALAAALQLGSVAQAQNANADVETDLIPPGPTDVEAGAEIDDAANADVEADVEAPSADDVEAPSAEVESDPAQPRNSATAPRGEALGPPPRAAGNAGDELPDVTDDSDQTGPMQREARYLPAEPGQDSGISERVRAATANLDIDDATRSRYRWNNGEWWFQTKSGSWKFHRDGAWQDFDPTTYQPQSSHQSQQPGIIYSDGPAPLSGPTNFAPSQGYSYAPQSTYSSGGVILSQPYSSGSYYGNQPYRSYQSDGRFYRSGYGWNDGRGYNRGYSRNDGFYGRGYGYGYGGYNPRNDRYYGRTPYGGRYSIDGDRYRGGMIGSQIGGQVGGRSGAILGGFIGAEAAD